MQKKREEAAGHTLLKANRESRSTMGNIRRSFFRAAVIARSGFEDGIFSRHFGQSKERREKEKVFIGEQEEEFHSLFLTAFDDDTDR